MNFDALPEGLYAQLLTSKGQVVLFLEYEKTPYTVANFVGLAEGVLSNQHKPPGAPYYDGTIFHRVEPDFMIQGGDPTATGRGGPGYRFQDEMDLSLKYNKSGILGMANAGPHTNGSQFFITHRAVPQLNYRHTVFGHVVEGMRVVNSMKKGDQIDKLRIVRNGSKVRNYDPLLVGLKRSYLDIYD